MNDLIGTLAFFWIAYILWGMILRDARRIHNFIQKRVNRGERDGNPSLDSSSHLSPANPQPHPQASGYPSGNPAHPDA